MIILDESLFIAEGLVKKSYLHPSNTKLCIKLCKPIHKAKVHLEKELQYLNKIQKKNLKNLSYPFFSNFLGTTETNLGKGYLYDLVYDETTNEKSRTLEFYLNNNNSSTFNIKLEQSIEVLRNEMIVNKVFAHDLVARNICCKVLKNGDLQLVIVDGMGHRDFFPVADYLSYFAKKKIDRRFIKSDFYLKT
jgi:hypothetical protein